MAWVTSQYDGSPYDDSIPRFIDYGDQYLWDRIHGRRVTRESIDAFAAEKEIDLTGEIGPAPEGWGGTNTVDGFPFSDHSDQAQPLPEATTTPALPDNLAVDQPKVEEQATEGGEQPPDAGADGSDGAPATETAPEQQPAETPDTNGEQPSTDESEKPKPTQLPADQEREWGKMSSHSDLNNFLASHSEVEQPPNWSTMTIAQKKQFFDDNTDVIIIT